MNLIKRQSNWSDPFDLLQDFETEMSRALSGSLRARTGDNWAMAFSPEVDIEEEENQYLVRADLPGLKKEDIDISVTGNTLVLKGQRKEETKDKKKGQYHFERRFGSFTRAFEFPTEVDAGQIKAAYKDGVLHLTVPKSERAKPKQIKVDVN